jgi:predicted ATPase
MAGPLQLYLDGVSLGKYQRDESQEVALRLLQKLFDEIEASADQKLPGLLSRLLGGKGNPD